MRGKSKFLIVILICAVNTAMAQGFESDSIYYTPISKKTETKSAPRKIFQDTVKNYKKIEYFFNVQSGTMIGCDDCDHSKEITFTTSTTHGIIIGRKLRTGIGIGFDSYNEWTTLPIFGSLSWDLLGSKNTHALFIEANYGWSKPWIKKSEWIAGSTSVDGGAMASALVGYRVKYHDVKISLAIGTKSQRLYRYYEYPTFYYRPDGVLVEGSPNKTTVKEDLNRLMISLAIGWK